MLEIQGSGTIGSELEKRGFSKVFYGDLIKSGLVANNGKITYLSCKTLDEEVRKQLLGCPIVTYENDGFYDHIPDGEDVKNYKIGSVSKVEYTDDSSVKIEYIIDEIKIAKLLDNKELGLSITYKYIKGMAGVYQGIEYEYEILNPIVCDISVVSNPKYNDLVNVSLNSNMIDNKKESESLYNGIIANIQKLLGKKDVSINSSEEDKKEKDKTSENVEEKEKESENVEEEYQEDKKEKESENVEEEDKKSENMNESFAKSINNLEEMMGKILSMLEKSKSKNSNYQTVSTNSSFKGIDAIESEHLENKKRGISGLGKETIEILKKYSK